MRFKRIKTPSADIKIKPFKPDNPDLPVVTVQVPLYNELYVAKRVIDCITQFNYPSQKLEIQILDDSTDETYDIVEKRVKYWQAGWCWKKFCRMAW